MPRNNALLHNEARIAPVPVMHEDNTQDNEENFALVHEALGKLLVLKVVHKE